MLARHYTPDVRPEGQTASSKGFSQREQAEEGQYIKKRELEKLKEAKEKLKAAQAEVVSVALDHSCYPWHRPISKGGRAGTVGPKQ